LAAAIGCPDLPAQAQANCGNPAINVMSAVVPINPARKTLGMYNILSPF
jgi:hypothetical protein